MKTFRQPMSKLLYIFPSNHRHFGLNQKVRGQIKGLSAFFEVRPLWFEHDENTPKWRLTLLALRFQLLAFFLALSSRFVFIRFNPKLVILNLLLIPLSWIKTVIVEFNGKDKELAYLKRHKEKKLFNFFVRSFIFGRFYIISVTEDIKNTLTQKGLPNSKIIVIPNGISTEENTTCKIPHHLHKKLEHLKKHHLKLGVLIGNGYPWIGIEKAIALFPDPDIQILVIGDFPKMKSPNNFHFLGKLNLDEIQTVYSFCDFGIGSLNSQLIGLTESSPLKVSEYLYFGLPVISNEYVSQANLKRLKPFFYITKQSPLHTSAFIHFLNSYPKSEIATKAREDLNWEALYKENLIPKVLP